MSSGSKVLLKFGQVFEPNTYDASNSKVADEAIRGLGNRYGTEKNVIVIHGEQIDKTLHGKLINIEWPVFQGMLRDTYRLLPAELQDHHKRFKHIFCRCLTGNKESETTAIYMNNPQLNPHWDESIESLCPKDKNEIRIDVKKKDHYYSKEVMIGSVTLSFPKEAFSGLPLNRTIYLKDNKGSEMIDSINLNFQFRATQSSDSSRPSGRQTRSTDSQIVSLARKQSGILKITIAEVNLQYYPMYSEIFCRCCIGTKVMETCTIPITDRRRMEWKNTPLEW
ncbi:hypothetical protein ScPMuIL_012955 [Solemya velum]